MIQNALFAGRPSERTAEDLDVIYSKLKELKVLEKFHPLLLQQLCYYGYYESLEKGVTRECTRFVWLLSEVSLYPESSCPCLFACVCACVRS